MGIVGYVEKSFAIDNLLVTIRKVLHQTLTAGKLKSK